MRFNRSAFIIAAAALAAAPTFAADVSIGVGINLPGVAFPVPAPPPVYLPAPVYVAPPRPVYVAPPRAVYYAPAPRYYGPEYRHHRRHGDWDDNDQGHRGEWKRDRHGGRGDRD